MDILYFRLNVYVSDLSSVPSETMEEFLKRVHAGIDCPDALPIEDILKGERNSVVLAEIDLTKDEEWKPKGVLTRSKVNLDQPPEMEYPTKKGKKLKGNYDNFKVFNCCNFREYFIIRKLLDGLTYQTNNQEKLCSYIDGDWSE